MMGTVDPNPCGTWVWITPHYFCSNRCCITLRSFREFGGLTKWRSKLPKQFISCCGWSNGEERNGFLAGEGRDFGKFFYQRGLAIAT